MRLLLLSIILGTCLPLWGQKYISDQGTISFFSNAPLEDIKANTEEATSVIDLATGEIAFSVPIKSFEFRKSLMQQHFNENYMDSEKYPKSTFKGKILNFKPSPGTYKATAEGQLTIKGKTNKVQVEGTVVVKEQSVELEAVFPVALKDYKIKIPKILFSNIAETVEVTVKFQYKPYAPN